MGSASEGHGVREVPSTNPIPVASTIVHVHLGIRPGPVRLPSRRSPYLSVTLCHHSSTLHPNVHTYIVTP